jgi:acetyl esterase
MAVPLQIRAQQAATQLLFALPKPIRIDGLELSLDAQLLMRLQQLSRADLVRSDDVEAVRRLLDLSRHLVSGAQVEPVTAREVDLDGIAATLYAPAGLPEPSGLLVFYHGGGWTIGSRVSHDNTARYLAKRAGVRVLSVEYRLAPEFPFPGAAEDAVAAFEHAHAKAADLGADPDRIAVGGDSAGGNLATVTALVTARRGGPVPVFQLLFYPVTDLTVRRRSRQLFGKGFFLTDEHMTWFGDRYAPEGVDRAEPRLSPLLADDLSGMPPAYIATAGFDPLRDEGEAYALKLRESGVPVTLSRQGDLIHGYVNFLGVGRRFTEALSEAAGALRVGLELAGRDRDAAQ